MRLLAFIGALAIVVAIGAGVFFFGGFYSVGANVEEPGIVKWALVRVRMASIEKHATTAPPAGFDAADKVQAGARAFLARGCTNCHGGPGVNWAKFSEGLRPDPPDLKEVAPHRTPGQLFWVVKNGINMTGMPSFGAIQVPDPELWNIVAFLTKLPTVKDADFKTWTTAAAAPAPAAPAPAAPAPAPAAPKP
jgi:hypothetical protein